MYSSFVLKCLKKTFDLTPEIIFFKKKTILKIVEKPSIIFVICYVF